MSQVVQIRQHISFHDQKCFLTCSISFFLAFSPSSFSLCLLCCLQYLHRTNRRCLCVSCLLLQASLESYFYHQLSLGQFLYSSQCLEHSPTYQVSQATASQHLQRIYQLCHICLRAQHHTLQDLRFSFSSCSFRIYLDWVFQGHLRSFQLHCLYQSKEFQQCLGQSKHLKVLKLFKCFRKQPSVFI